jgi:putative nucleotidyltransferase with HDIG domain
LTAVADKNETAFFVRTSMADEEKKEDNYVAVNILPFREATRDINFDVFLKLSEKNYAHVFSNTTGLDYKRLESYIDKGIKVLYIRSKDMPLYHSFISNPAEKVFSDPNASSEKKIASLLNMTEQNMAEIFSKTGIEERTAQKTQKVVKGYVETMGKNPQTLAVMLKLVSHGEYLYYHSIATSIFSLFLAKASGQFNKRMLELVGMGGFLHDIGATQIPASVVDSVDELDPEASTEMFSHPKLGMNMLETTPNITDEVRYIVYQHHEEPGGNGYPNRIGGPVIFYPAKIVSVADAFSGLISNRPFREAMDAPRAIEFMRSQPGKYDRDLINILAAIFERGGAKAA